MDVIAKEGRMPPEFVSKHWADAGDSTRVEFCKFAEMQLTEYGDEGLHRFLAGVVFGTEQVVVVQAAWTSLFRWYGREDKLLIQSEALERFFGSIAGFVGTFRRFLLRADLVEIVGNASNRERLAKFLRYVHADVLPGFVVERRAVSDLVDAVAAVMKNHEFDFLIRLAGADFLALVGSERVFRDQVEALLTGFLGTDLNLASSNALERIRKVP